MSEQDRWFVRLWFAVAIGMAAYAVHSAVLGNYGLMAGQLVLAAVYAAAAVVFIKVRKS